VASNFHQHLLDHIDKVSGPPSYPRLGKTLRAVVGLHAPMTVVEKNGHPFGVQDESWIACSRCKGPIAECEHLRVIARELGVPE